jgi:hypothetical protein
LQQQIDMGALQKTFVKPIVDYLYQVATTPVQNPGGIQPPAVTTYTLSFTVDPATVTSYQCIFALTTLITMQRINNVSPDFSNVPGVAITTTPVQPYVQQSGGGTGASSSLLYFTQLFETAFNNKASTVIYKVSTATNFSTASSDPVTTPPIWIIRLDTTGKQGINVAYTQLNNNTLAYYFAPIPLATSLQNFTANIVPYATGAPFDPYGKGATTNYSSIDLDNWGQQFLAAVDKFLSPAYAVPAFLLDNGVSLQSVLDAKQTLAAAITGTVDYIIETPKGDTSLANVNNAQEKWYQQLLRQLSATYNYTAAVQTPVTVQSCWTGPNNDPPQAGSPPRLYGKITATPPVTGAGDTSPEQDATFSAVKLPIAEGSSWLTYMFQMQNGPEQYVNFPEVDFEISHVEWNYEAVEGIDGYLASSWLLIVNPQPLSTASAIPESFTNLGETVIPIPLKAYPSSPSVSAQSANYPSANPPQTNNPVLVARSWDYASVYQSSPVPQDTTVLQVQFNVTPKDKSALRAMDGPVITLDQALAQFISMYPQLSADFDQYLVNVQSANDPNAKNAANAVNAFISLLNVMGIAWGSWNQVNPFKPIAGALAAARKLADPVPALVTLNYTIEETHAGSSINNPLIINVSPFADNVNSQLIPVINIDGYTVAQTVSDGITSYTYTNIKTGKPLLYSDRSNIPGRNPVFETLDVFATQNGRAGLQLKRNLFLLPQPGSTTQWQTTNPLFVYQTPMVMFYSLYQPLFSLNAGIDIATIPSPNGTLPAQRTLLNHFIAWANALTINTNGLTSLTIKVESLYNYQPGATSLTMSMPVLLLPPYPLTVADNGQAFANLLAGNISYWFSKHNPVTSQGQWVFNLQVFSSFGANLPMLSRQFYLNLSAVSAS